MKSAWEFLPVATACAASVHRQWHWAGGWRQNAVRRPASTRPKPGCHELVLRLQAAVEHRERER
eukprot:3298833-Rhodomonas_salina.4